VPQIGVLGFRRGNILTLTLRPLGNQSPPKDIIWRKTVLVLAEIWSPESLRGAQEILLKIK